MIYAEGVNSNVGFVLDLKAKDYWFQLKVQGIRKCVVIHIVFEDV